MPYISPHGGSTEQQLGTDAEPPRSSELYPPEPPCWQDQWLSKITDTHNNVGYDDFRYYDKENRQAMKAPSANQNKQHKGTNVTTKIYEINRIKGINTEKLIYTY